ncbi:hypothetical protein Vadar_009431 [Vaccinium darrowii]|uniref:Uncharacterized protein n=1 Tax=Vaccinium darrowii TaxID=229202 RepID=A0ACB7XZF1_9ERIC|nr:hypothetical protein Vadar_009431 [Vaccinium darrowii]
MMVSYTTWLLHGELPQTDEQGDSEDENDDNGDDDYEQLMEDHYKGTYMDSDTTEREDMRNFEQLVEAAKLSLYPGCNDTLLSFVIEMLQVQVEHGWSNTSFNKFLSRITRFLPEGHVVPQSIHECKKLLRDLGLGYELIHACPKDCVLFWKENAHLDNVQNVGVLGTRSMMVDDDQMRHPADAPQWKEFDRMYPEFSQETRNVRLGLATDGFNPFGNMSTSYSMWPVILMSYNLPPWKCMKDPFFMMSLLILGPNQPGTNIDVYLRTLVDELNDLWKNGVMTYDASNGETFRMHVAVIGTIHDFPAYEVIDKIGWVGHRAYLPENHPWRKGKKFDGSYEFAKESFELSMEKVKARLDRLRPVEFGKDTTGSKRSRHPTELNWTKKSLLWELPYFESLLIRHFLDVMHIEKNICESIYGTMLSIDGKNKDTYKAREDLKQRGIRPKLHLRIIENGSIVKPRATYTLDPHQVERFYEFLKSIRYPDGYAANISRCVTSKNGRSLGMKSHDCHVLLQRLLPIGMRGFMNDLRTQGSEEATEELWSLANGPGSIIDLYSGCICNGVRFHTRDRENRRMCQNSGIAVEGVYKGENVNFYGYLNKIWELRYAHGGRVVLFQCEWYNTSRKSRIYTDEHVTSIDITRLWFKEDPFVLPHNVRQVFYINDTSKGKNWRVVEPVRHRGVWDVLKQDQSPHDPFQQEETVDGGVPISVEDFEVQYNRDNVNLETIPNDDFMAVHVDDQDNEDDTKVEYMDVEDDDLSGQNDLDDFDVDLEVDYDI